MMHKKLIYFIIISSMLFVAGLLPVYTISAGPVGTPSSCTGGLCNPLKHDTIEKFVDAIADIVLQIGSVVAVFFIIYSGFLFVVARGSEEKITRAKTVFMWTIVGAAVLLGAAVVSKAIVNFVQGLK